MKLAELNSIRQAYKEARKAYLEQCHLEEREILRDSWKNQYFYLDGHKLFMPDEVSSIRGYMRSQKYLLKYNDTN